MEGLVKPRQIDGRYVNPWMEDGSLNLEKSRKQAKKIAQAVNPSKTELDLISEMKVVKIIKRVISRPSEIGVQMTWLGHSTVFFQFDGINVLTDPVFSKSVGGMIRYRDVPCLPHELPPIDVVVISHDHFDHLDINSIASLNSTCPKEITWLVPLGVKTLLPKSCKKVFELQWWDEHSYRKEITTTVEENEVGTNLDEDGFDNEIKEEIKKIIVEATFAFVPSQHCSQRGRGDHNKRLWGGWAITGRHSRVYFSGDTGYCDVFKSIGNKYGPFDVATIPIGGFKPTEHMRCMNCDPDEAVKIHKDVGAKRSIGIHWGTFMVGSEHFLEPVQLLQAAVDRANLADECFSYLRQGETRVFGGQYDDDASINNEHFFSRRKNMSSKFYNYSKLAVTVAPPPAPQSSVCVIL